MDNSKLYKFAYKLHYEEENIDEALKIYNRIIIEFPNTKETEYAKTQIKVIETMNQDKRNRLNNSNVSFEELVSAYQKENQDNFQVEGLEEKLRTLIITTTNHIDGYKIKRYIDIHSVEIVMGTGIFSESITEINDLMGMRSTLFETKLAETKKVAFSKLKKDAVLKGGNAIIGVDMDYTQFTNNRTGLIANGTIVEIIKDEDIDILKQLSVIEKLGNFREQGLITEEEFLEKKNKILNNI